MSTPVHCDNASVGRSEYSASDDGSWRHTPHRVAHIVRDQQGSPAIDGNADRAASGFVVLAEEAAQHVLRQTGWTSICKRHEDHLVAAERSPVPRSVLTHEGA